MRKFYKRFRSRIPRKLKKAAKYGINHCIKERYTKEDYKFSLQEIHFWTILGRRTKWKVKAAYKCATEYKRMLTEEQLSWLTRQNEGEILAELKEKQKYFQGKIPDIPPYNPVKFHNLFFKL